MPFTVSRTDLIPPFGLHRFAYAWVRVRVDIRAKFRVRDTVEGKAEVKAEVKSQGSDRKLTCSTWASNSVAS